MNTDRIAEASITINAPRTTVWEALVDPAAIKEYMFGTTVITDWRAGSPIRWRGEWKGKHYEDFCAFGTVAPPVAVTVPVEAAVGRAAVASDRESSSGKARMMFLRIRPVS